MNCSNSVTNVSQTSDPLHLYGSNPNDATVWSGAGAQYGQTWEERRWASAEKVLSE